MAKKSLKKSTLMKRLIVPMIAASLVQSLLFYCILSFSGAIDRLDRSGERLLRESNSKRAVYLETEMLSKWSNLSNITEAADKACRKITAENGITAAELLESKEFRTIFLEEISGELLNTMRINSVNGVFTVLANNAKMPDRKTYALYDGIYFNDGDTSNNPPNYSDVILVRGPGRIAAGFSIPYDIMWQENYKNTENNNTMNFFFDPVEAAYSHPEISERDLGVWNSVLYHYPNIEYGQENIVTYSEPIIVDGVILGSAGISLSMEHIAELISPVGNGWSGSSGFYFFAEENIPGGDRLKISCVSGKNNEITSYSEDIFYMEDTGKNNIYSIRDEKINDSQAYCTFERLNLYGERSPYDRGSFVVGAAMGENDLYRNSWEVRKNLLTAFFISVIIFSAATYFTARVIVKPIKKLAENVSRAADSSAIEIVDTGITEIHDLSVTLNDLYSKNAEYRDELIAERERYLIALSSMNDHIIEYDCINDIFFIHYFISSKEGGSVKLRRFENFRQLIDDGKICPEDGMSAMLKFISTDAAENGIYIKVFSGGNDRILWFFAKGKAIYDGSKLIKIIASSKDVTDEKEREQKSLEKKRRNNITGFYNNKYGSILTSRFMVEMRHKTSVSAVVSIVQFKEFLNKYGTALCDAILEEAAVVIRKNIPEDYIVYHGQKSGLIILTPIESRDEARKLFGKIINGIENVYGGSVGDDGIHIDCVIGACFCENGNGISILRRKLKIAEAASLKFGNEFGGIVFEDEVADREDFMREFESADQEDQEDTVPKSAFENSNIVAFAFNIFEKTGDFNAAVYAFMCRTGRELDLERIMIFEINSAQCSMKIIHQWNSPVMAPIEVSNYILEKDSFDRYVDKLRNSGYIPADRAVFDKDAYRGSGRMTGNGAAIAVPMFDNDNIIGCMTYELSSETADDSIIGCLKELTTIVSVYISKSGAVRESRAKSEFLSKMSHEIRTPINAIIGMTNIALSTAEGTPTINNYLGKIDSSSHYLLSIINDILDMSRIENGKMTTEETYINLEKLIGQIYDMIRIQTDSKGIWLRLDKEIEHPHLLGDPLKLNQVLVNILGNAVKFTSRGGISLYIKETPTTEKTVVNMYFSVKDTGIGISKENLGRIFNSFEQADEKTMRQYGGTGLGLAISSNLVRLLGGRLEVKSVPGSGSEFYFTLPMKITDSIPEDDNAAANVIDFSAKIILVVEDDDLNREIACTLLENEGLKTETAENGQVAAEMFEKSEAGHYDAILMDIRMPVMNGIEATKTIRAMDKADALTVPIIAMTANAFDEDMKKSMESGMNSHLTKPINIKNVIEILHKLWGRG